MDHGRYLERIGYDGPVEPDLTTLRRLHRQHLLHVPFENLDIHLNRPLRLELPALFAKIVGRRRGGLCYELNGLFAWLLRELGFEVSLLSARVVVDGCRPGPEFDHMVLLVQLEDAWLADVGFGESFLEPISLGPRGPQFDGRATHRIGRSSSSSLAVERRASSRKWVPQYVFTTRSRQMDEFEGMSIHHQTSPDSHFTRKRLCSMATATGRRTLSDLTLIESRHGQRTEITLADEAEWLGTLRELFGVELHWVDGLKRVRLDINSRIS